jgi:hypothetical protein
MQLMNGNQILRGALRPQTMGGMGEMGEKGWGACSSADRVWVGITREELRA